MLKDWGRGRKEKNKRDEERMGREEKTEAEADSESTQESFEGFITAEAAEVSLDIGVMESCPSPLINLFVCVCVCVSTVCISVCVLYMGLLPEEARSSHWIP